MKITLSEIKRMIETGAAVDRTHAPDQWRPLWRTFIAYSLSENGRLDGVVIRDDYTGIIYAVAGRCENLFLLTYRNTRGY